MKIKKERLGWHIQPETNQEREKVEWLLGALHHRYGVVRSYEAGQAEMEQPGLASTAAGYAENACTASLYVQMQAELLAKPDVRAQWEDNVAMFLADFTPVKDRRECATLAKKCVDFLFDLHS